MRLSDPMKFALAFVLLLPSLVLGAQGIREALAGSGYPISYAPNDFPEDYKAAEIALAGADVFSSYFTLSFTSGGDTGAVKLYEAIKMTWTKGEMVTVEGQKYLVTYRLDVDPIKFAMRRDTAATAATDALMTLHLIRTDSILSLEPEPLYTKDKLLEAVGTPIGPNPSQMAAKKTATLSNLKQVDIGTMMYLSDYDDVMPYAQSTRAVAFVTEPYMKNRELWKTYNPNGGKIQFNMALAGVNSSDIDKPAETPIFYETKEWPDGSRCVAFADGHAKIIAKNNWPEIERALAWRFKRKGKPFPLDYGSSFKFPDESPPKN